MSGLPNPGRLLTSRNEAWVHAERCCSDRVLAAARNARTTRHRPEPAEPRETSRHHSMTRDTRPAENARATASPLILRTPAYTSPSPCSWHAAHVCGSSHAQPDPPLPRSPAPNLRRAASRLRAQPVPSASPKPAGWRRRDARRSSIPRAHGPTYSFSSERRRASAFVTLMLSSAARVTISLRLREETLCAISAAYLRFCIMRTSRSLMLLTRKR